MSSKKAPTNCPRSSLWKFLGRSDAPVHVIFDLGWQSSLTAWYFPFPLQALPVRPLLPVFLAAIGAEEPRRYALQWQAFQVWLLRPGLCWCYNTQQPHPDTHWGKALQVSTWSQQHLPAVIRREVHSCCSLAPPVCTSTWERLSGKPWPDKSIYAATKIGIKQGLFSGALQAQSNFLSSDENLIVLIKQQATAREP